MKKMKVALYPYHPGSQSAKKLANLLGVKRMRHVGSKLPLKMTTLINWGSSSCPEAAKVYNSMAGKASNKRTALISMAAQGVKVPPFTVAKEEAQQWLTNGKRVFARTILNGHSGAGIVNIKGKDGVLPDAPLYVEYIQKSAEYRAHVVRDNVFFIQQKKKRTDVEVTDKFIRSHKNGYVFCQNDIVVPEGLDKLAVAAVKAVKLDFGAVDIILGKDNQLYVLEVNTAPGLDNSSAEKYANALKTL